MSQTIDDASDGSTSSEEQAAAPGRLPPWATGEVSGLYETRRPLPHRSAAPCLLGPERRLARDVDRTYPGRGGRGVMAPTRHARSGRSCRSTSAGSSGSTSTGATR